MYGQRESRVGCSGASNVSTWGVRKWEEERDWEEWRGDLAVNFHAFVVVVVVV